MVLKETVQHFQTEIEVSLKIVASENLCRFNLKLRKLEHTEQDEMKKEKLRM